MIDVLFVMPVVPVLTRTRADLQHAFEICNKSTNAQKFSHVVVYATVEEKQTWLKEVKQLVKEFQRKEAMARKEALEKGALWGIACAGGDVGWVCRW